MHFSTKPADSVVVAKPSDVFAWCTCTHLVPVADAVRSPLQEHALAITLGNPVRKCHVAFPCLLAQLNSLLAQQRLGVVRHRDAVSYLGEPLHDLGHVPLCQLRGQRLRSLLPRPLKDLVVFKATERLPLQSIKGRLQVDDAGSQAGHIVRGSCCNMIGGGRHVNW